MGDLLRRAALLIVLGFQFEALGQTLEIKCGAKGELISLGYSGTKGLFKKSEHSGAEIQFKTFPKLSQTDLNKGLSSESIRLPSSEVQKVIIEYPWQGFTKRLLHPSSDHNELVTNPIPEITQLALASDLDPFLLLSIVMAEDLPTPARWPYAEQYYNTYGTFPTDGRPYFSLLKCSWEKNQWSNVNKYPNLAREKKKLESVQKILSALNDKSTDFEYLADPIRERQLFFEHLLKGDESSLVEFYLSEIKAKLPDHNSWDQFFQVLKSRECAAWNKTFSKLIGPISPSLSLLITKCRLPVLQTLEAKLELARHEQKLSTLHQAYREAFAKHFKVGEGLEKWEINLLKQFVSCGKHCYGVRAPQVLGKSGKLPTFSLRLTSGEEIKKHRFCSGLSPASALWHGVSPQIVSESASAPLNLETKCCFELDVEGAAADQEQLVRLAAGRVGIDSFKAKVMDNIDDAPSLAHAIQRWNGTGIIGSTEKVGGCLNGVHAGTYPYYGARVLDVMISTVMSNKEIVSQIQGTALAMKSSMLSILCSKQGEGVHKIPLRKFRDELCGYVPRCC